MLYLGNAFSLNMLDLNKDQAIIKIKKISNEEAKKILENGFLSVIGHKELANIISKLLDIEIPTNRATIRLTSKEKMIVCQVIGERPPEGKILTEDELMNNYKIVFFLVEIL